MVRKKSKSTDLQSLKNSFDKLPFPLLWGESPVKLSHCNDQFLKIVNAESSDFTGMTWMSYVIKSEQKRIQKLIDVTAAEHTQANFPVSLKTSARKSKQYSAILANSENNGEIWFLLLIASNLLENPNSVVEEIIESHTVDETSATTSLGSGTYQMNVIPFNKNQVSKLEEIRSRFQYDLAQIVEYSADAITTYSLDGTIESWNGGACELYGYSMEEAIGKHLSFIVPEKRHDEIDSIIDSIKKNRVIETLETERITKDNSIVHVSLVVSPIKENSGEIIGGFSIARNITRRKQAEEALLSQAHQLSKTNAELEKFAWMAAHDLKEPIRTMTTYAHLVAGEIECEPDSEMATMLDYMTKAGLRATERIHDVLTYGSLGKKDFSLEKTDLNLIVKNVLDDLKQTIEESGAIIEVGELPKLKINKSTILLLFQNLISNAVKFCDKAPFIEIKAEKTKENFVFQLSDNGIGIDSTDSDRVFEMFSRLEPNQYSGTGIGLAICKKVVELHHGKIWYESTPGEGTTFYFTLAI